MLKAKNPSHLCWRCVSEMGTEMADVVVRGGGEEEAALDASLGGRSRRVPLESAFEEWLHRRKLLSHSTVATHITRLRRAIADYGIRRFLMSAVADKQIRQTQLYYKEFLCEYYMPLLLPLLQGEECVAEENLEGRC